MFCLNPNYLSFSKLVGTGIVFCEIFFNFEETKIIWQGE